MYCGQCGKKNPEEARFCAFCGQPLNAEGEKTVKTAGARDADAEAARRGAGEENERFMRPDPSRQVRPLTDNPAQPGHEKPRQAPRAAGEADRPAAEARVPRRSRGAIAGGGERLEPPARPAPIRPEKRAGVSTLIPRRMRKTEDELFFDELNEPAQSEWDEEQENRLGRKLRSGVLAALFLCLLGFVFWFLVMPGGAIFRANLGLGAPASAYYTLGGQYRAEGSIRRAADAYMNALRLDSGNYEYAYLVGQTQELVGDREKALSAYALCIKLKETAPEPYLAAAEIYRQTGEEEKRVSVLTAGYERTGDTRLYKALKGEEG